MSFAFYISSHYLSLWGSEYTKSGTKRGFAYIHHTHIHQQQQQGQQQQQHCMDGAACHHHSFDFFFFFFSSSPFLFRMSWYLHLRAPISTYFRYRPFDNFLRLRNLPLQSPFSSPADIETRQATSSLLFCCSPCFNSDALPGLRASDGRTERQQQFSCFFLPSIPQLGEMLCVPYCPIFVLPARHCMRERSIFCCRDGIG